MGLQNFLNYLMGVRFEDEREPSIVHFPDAVKCPVKDCEELGRYTNCYIPRDWEKCNIYNGRSN